MTTAVPATTAVRLMAEAAGNLLATLSAVQRAKATFAFDDHAERIRWYYFPEQQGGLPIGELSQEQEMLAHKLLRAGLSPQAYARATQIMSLESVLGQIEGSTGRFVRDPGRYYLSIFGEPSATGSWAWRWNGHHICINYTIVNGQPIAATPMFLGSNPARVEHDGYDIVRVLGDAEDLARALLHSLDEAQRATAVVSERSPIDISLGNLPHPDAPHGRSGIPGLPPMFGGPPLPDAQHHLDQFYYDATRPIGINAGKLSAGQRDLLARLVRHYSSRFPEGVAWKEIDQIEGLHFAWAGGREPREKHYYRIQGDALIVEYDNTQDGGNHVHTVCRHPKDDFGARILKLHHLWDHA